MADTDDDSCEAQGVNQEAGAALVIVTRKVAEKLMIGPDITCTVLGVTDNQVRFGLELPKGMSLKPTGESQDETLS